MALHYLDLRPRILICLCHSFHGIPGVNYRTTGSDDPQEDPDYDSAGWGTQSASVSYTQLIPLLVKSNQELHERIVDLESAQVTYDAQIADLEAANDAKQRRIDELEERVNALVARMEAVENV